METESCSDQAAKIIKKKNNKHLLFSLASHLFSSSLETPSLFCYRSGFYQYPSKRKRPSPPLPAPSPPQHLRVAAKAVCCEGICAGFPSISWIYSSKSEPFYTSLSSLSANVRLGGKKTVRVRACVSDYKLQVYTFQWRLKGHGAI